MNSKSIQGRYSGGLEFFFLRYAVNAPLENVLSVEEASNTHVNQYRCGMAAFGEAPEGRTLVGFIRDFLKGEGLTGDPELDQRLHDFHPQQLAQLTPIDESFRRRLLMKVTTGHTRNHPDRRLITVCIVYYS